MRNNSQIIDGGREMVINGRLVIAVPINAPGVACADCGQPAKLTIYETETDYHWNYCGACEIG